MSKECDNINSSTTVTIIMPCGLGARAVLDTLESVRHYCPCGYNIIIIDDFTNDGTYESVVDVCQPNWHILRNEKRFGTVRLVHSLCKAYDYFLNNINDSLVLRLDQDALLIGYGVIEDAFNFMSNNEKVGIFGVHSNDYNRERSFAMHAKLIDEEMSIYNRYMFRKPSWCSIYKAAVQKGYRKGENVFGGAYFITRECLLGIKFLGGLQVPYKWNSRMQEDVYFSMATVAAGFKMGHFAAPNGPLCLEWRGLPYPAAELIDLKYKIVHSVDKGKNTSPLENNGMTARDYFKKVRQA